MSGTRTFDYDQAKLLREQGMTYQEIGRTLGVTAETARLACNDDARALRRHVAWPAVEKRALIERIGDHFQFAPDGCWHWTGAKYGNGYGAFWTGHRNERAHRAMYELLVGAIPTGLTIDHLCSVRHCVNPAHLEPVTLAENVRRGYERRHAAARENDIGVEGSSVV